MDIGQLVANVSADLNDAAHSRWSVAELVEYLNTGIVQIVTTRPESSSERRTLSLSAGATQTVPADAVTLLDVICNVPTGRNIRSVHPETLKASSSMWRGNNRSSVIYDYAYSPEKSANRFEVYPPAVQGTMIEVEVSVLPAALTSVADPWDLFPLDDEYAEAAEAWMKHKALMRVGGEASLPRANGYLQLFYRLLGIHMNSQAAAATNGGSQ